MMYMSGKSGREENPERIPSSPPTNPVGFTLAELLVVIVILGIAAMVVIPTIHDNHDFEVSSAARLLVADLMFAQTYAIAQKHDYQVVFDMANETYEIQNPDDGSVITHPVNKTPYRVDFPASEHMNEVTLTTADFDATNLVRFNSLGIPYNGGGNQLAARGKVTLSAGKFNVDVTVEPISGRINSP